MDFPKSTLIELGANKKTDKSLILFVFWRRCEIGVAFFVVLSLISSAIDYEINFSPYRDYGNCMEEYNEISNLRWMTFASSMSAIALVLIGTYSQYLWEDYLYITDFRTD